MKMQSFSARCMSASAVFCAVLAMNGPASAGPKLFAYSGSGITFNGTTETTANGNVDPFVVELFSSGNECLRVAVTAQGTDLEATLVAPDGRTWRDDDGNGSLRPLVKAITTKRGWHILRLSRFDGGAVNADFTVTVHRLASTHAACNPPTSPVTTALAPAARKPAAAMAPTAGGTQ